MQDCVPTDVVVVVLDVPTELVAIVVAALADVIRAVVVVVVTDCWVDEVRNASVVDVTALHPFPEQLEILMSPQFQNFSPPLPFVFGSLTAAEQAFNPFENHDCTLPPNFDAIQSCVNTLL